MAELTSRATPPDCVFGTKAGHKNCKSEPSHDSAGASPLCPRCKSSKVWRDGQRETMFGEQIQRWSCRNCGYRFSDPNDLKKTRNTVETLETKISKATPEYAKTKDILRVMKMLGHKSIQNTLLYTQLVNFENDEFYSGNAKTVEEAQKLIEAGFEYVCNFEEIKLFRKRK